MFIQFNNTAEGTQPDFQEKDCCQCQKMRITVQMGKKHQQQIVNHANIQGSHTASHNFKGVGKLI
jgi:hypothetical protein